MKPSARRVQRQVEQRTQESQRATQEALQATQDYQRGKISRDELERALNSARAITTQNLQQNERARRALYMESIEPGWIDQWGAEY